MPCMTGNIIENRVVRVMQTMSPYASIKLRSHMRGAVAERRRADVYIPSPLPRVCSHIRGEDAKRTRADLPFLEDNDGLFGARGFEADAANWVLDPFLAERILLPLCLRSATAHV